MISSVTDAQGNATSFTYDARGNRLSSTGALSNTTNFAYDVMNRLTAITQPGNIVTSFGYDTRPRCRWCKLRDQYHIYGCCHRRAFRYTIYR